MIEEELFISSAGCLAQSRIKNTNDGSLCGKGSDLGRERACKHCQFNGSNTKTEINMPAKLRQRDCTRRFDGPSKISVDKS